MLKGDMGVKISQHNGIQGKKRPIPIDAGVYTASICANGKGVITFEGAVALSATRTAAAAAAPPPLALFLFRFRTNVKEGGCLSFDGNPALLLNLKPIHHLFVRVGGYNGTG